MRALVRENKTVSWAGADGELDGIQPAQVHHPTPRAPRLELVRERPPEEVASLKGILEA